MRMVRLSHHWEFLIKGMWLDCNFLNFVLGEKIVGFFVFRPMGGSEGEKNDYRIIGFHFGADPINYQL